VVEIHFSQYYRGARRWVFEGKSGPAVDMVIIDFHTFFEHGYAMIHKLGVALFKFKAVNPGLLSMNFACGNTLDPDPLEITTPEPAIQKLTINFLIK